jgi:hypothetical protein
LHYFFFLPPNLLGPPAFVQRTPQPEAYALGHTLNFLLAADLQAELIFFIGEVATTLILLF